MKMCGERIIGRSRGQYGVFQTSEVGLLTNPALRARSVCEIVSTAGNGENKAHVSRCIEEEYGHGEAALADSLHIFSRVVPGEILARLLKSGTERGDYSICQWSVGGPIAGETGPAPRGRQARPRV